MKNPILYFLRSAIKTQILFVILFRNRDPDCSIPKFSINLSYKSLSCITAGCWNTRSRSTGRGSVFSRIRIMFRWEILSNENHSYL